MIRNIIGPEIVLERKSKVEEKNIWFFIELINQQLKKNPINKDGSIVVKTPHIIDVDFLDRIVSMYKDAGWADITCEYVYSSTNEPDWTVATFKIG